jgi:ADP-heptose:LPS heptosyltransferase
MPLRHILLVATDRVGDLVWLTAGVRLIRETLPEARITVVASPSAGPVLEGNPHVARRIHVITPGGRRLRSLASHVRAGLALRLARPPVDAAIEFNRGRWHPLLLRLAGAGLVAGTRPDQPVSVPLGPVGHLAAHRVALVEALLGVRARSLRPELFPSAADEARAGALVREHGLERGFAVLHAGTSEVGRRPSRRRREGPRIDHRTWFEDRYAALAGHLLGRGLAVALTGVAGERGGIRRVIAAIDPALRPRPVDLAGRTTPLELAALLRRARLYVGGDTGPTHLATAVGAPTVCLYGPSPPWRSGPVEPAGPLRVLWTGVPCSPCDSETRRRCTDNVCMKTISAEAAIAASAELLDRPGGDPLPAPGAGVSCAGPTAP